MKDLILLGAFSETTTKRATLGTGGFVFAGDPMQLKAFSVVILGGLDSFIGAMVAGPIIGLCESFGGGYLTPIIGWAGVKDIIPFIIIIIVMVVKPYGLFGEERIERI